LHPFPLGLRCLMRPMGMTLISDKSLESVATLKEAGRKSMSSFY
jgi:hypothetical protein